MAGFLLIVGVIIFICVIFQKLSLKVGVSGLFVFILLGMIFGSESIFHIKFDNYELVKNISIVALVFIVFYGGAGTKWSVAKGVAVKSLLLSSLGTLLTAFFIAIFSYFVLKFDLLESILIGGLICSTDAASVFSILRGKRINLKYQTASLLELESGSNDPFSYMLTVITLEIMTGANLGPWKIILMVVLQIVIGALCGVFTAFLVKLFYKYLKINTSGFEIPFWIGVTLVSYALPCVILGNGFLSAYVAGLIVGNINLPNKKKTIHFFNDFTSIMQMLLFFILGMVSLPTKLFGVMGIGLIIALFLTFIARPLAVFITLSGFKAKLNQMVFVSLAGMRGAASIVFGLIAITKDVSLQHDIFHIVFFIVLFSILIQGTLLPLIAKKLNMIDEEEDVMKTFTDYSSEVPVEFIQFKLSKDHPWENHTLASITLPPECIIVLIIRGEKRIVPKGNTILRANDEIILSGKEGSKVSGVSLYEKTLDKDDPLIGKEICNIDSKEQLIVLIKRNNNVIIPRGATILELNDILVINNTENLVTE